MASAVLSSSLIFFVSLFCSFFFLLLLFLSSLLSLCWAAAFVVVNGRGHGLPSFFFFLWVSFVQQTLRNAPLLVVPTRCDGFFYKNSVTPTHFFFLLLVPCLFVSLIASLCLFFLFCMCVCVCVSFFFFLVCEFNPCVISPSPFSVLTLLASARLKLVWLRAPFFSFFFFLSICVYCSLWSFFFFLIPAFQPPKHTDARCALIFV